MEICLNELHSWNGTWIDYYVINIYYEQSRNIHEDLILFY